MKLPAGVRAVTKRRADGTIAVYYYHRITKTRLPPPDDPAFRKAFAEAHPKYGRYAPGTVGKLLTDYRQSPEWRDKAPMTQRRQLQYLYPLELVHHVPVSEITRAWVMEVRDKIAATRGNAAANAFAKITRTVFSWARDRGRIEYSPLDRIKSLKGGHLPAWTEEQFEYALPQLPEHLRRVLILGRYTGQRRGDLCRMTWADYDGHAIRVKQQKTGEELTIPIHTALKTELDQWKREATSTRILTSRRGFPWIDTHVSTELTQWVKTLKLPRGLNVHGLRKLAAASLAEAGCSTKEIAAITGHRTLSMVELYTASAERKQLAEAAILKLETSRGNRWQKRR